MRLPVLMIIILITGGLLIDTYIYFRLKKRCKSKTPAIIECISAIAMTLMLVVAVCLPRRSGDDSTLIAIMWMLFTYATVYIPKALFVLFDLVASIPCIFRHGRWSSLSWCGAALGTMLFIAMWWGAIINRNSMEVKEINIDIDNLPEAFDGYRIVQISDLHVGTFGNDTTFTSRFVDEVNSLHPDMIVFTGDIVNRHTPELKPHSSVLARLKAPDGVFSILGNHDYGDYCDWPNDGAKMENRQQLLDLQKQMGWRLLLNQHTAIKSGNDSIILIGVENVGDPPFHTYGSLPQAYSTPSDSTIKILLSHNPAHWVNDIADNDTMNIALTLSGHTHAMQMSILGMSPAAIRYKTWGGLYKDSTQSRQLYVNIGAGTVGIPMRLGATPEITIITLHRQ